VLREGTKEHFGALFYGYRKVINISMANRYWVGGTGTWDTTSTTNWSASTGGASGASVPTASDSVFFDQAATYTVTMTGALACLDITVSAGTVTFATGTSPTIAISGSMSLVAGTVWSSTGLVTFNSTATGKTITTNGVSISAGITFNGVGGAWTLGSALTTAGAITVTNGSFNASTYAVTAASLSSSNTNIRTIAVGSGKWTLTTGGWQTTTSTNLTITGTGTISLTSASSKSFAGGSKSYSGITLDQGGAGALTISGSNTFKDITNTYSTVGATIVAFSGGTTTTFTSFNLTGTAGKVCTFGSSTTTPAILQKPSAWLMGANSVDQGDNIGLSFTAGGGIDYVAVSFITGVVITSGISLSGMSISGGVTFA
jgi:hypothetical protein